MTDLIASPTIAVGKRARELREQGVDVVDFGPGEPDFVTPVHIRDAAVEAIQAGMTHYAPGRGLPKLRAAIARKLARENAVQYDPDTEIVVTPGAKQAIVEAILTAVAPSDEVIMFDPCWGSYDAIVRLAEGHPVHVQLRPDFSIDSELLEANLSSRTRAIIVGSPGNPTGHVLGREELDMLAEVCIRHDLLLVSDEIYERITYGDVTPISPASLPGMWERTVTINGLSKAYAMTG
ncbi:MAG: aspartate aminotransferase, partial [Chloroflexi bacterium]